MKFFTEKSLGYKIIIAIVIVVLFNFAAPTISSAGIGGILFEPIKSLLLVIADGVMQLTQGFMFNMGSSSTFVTIQNPDADAPKIAGWVTGILVGVGVAAALIAAPFTLGASLAVVAVGGTALLAGLGVNAVVTRLMTDAIPLKYKLPIFLLTPESIFSNEVPSLDINFFESPEAKAKKYNGTLRYEESTNRYYIKTNTATGTVEQPLTTMTLQPIISSWYYALRNFAIVALLLILVYTAIRIIISSSAEDKAKYKQRLVDWLVAMCLLFFMHYIMAFAVTLTEEISKAVSSANIPYYIDIGTKDSKISNYIYGEGMGEENIKQTIWDAPIADEFRSEGRNIIVSDGNTEHFMWPTTLMGKARLELQLDYTQVQGEGQLSPDDNEMRQFGYTVIYLALVVYTMLFLFRYLKRLLMLVFLTIIAPLMAMTYPLDKMKDGSAQGFNMWLKEYLYNLLIQPVHLILYTVLVGSAMDLVADNLIYALVALGFILQAEKLLRKFFGFDKASTVAGGSALGGALAMQGLNMVNKAIGRGSKGKGKGKGENGEGNSKGDKLTRGANSGHGTDTLFSNNQSGGQALEGGKRNPDNGEEATVAQRMVVAYDENNYGTDAYDSAEREAMAREAYQQEENEISGDDLRQQLREQGWSDEDIEDTLRDDPRYNNSQERTQDTAASSTQTEIPIEIPTETPTETPINTKRNLTLRNRAGMAFRHYAPKAGRGLANLALDKLPRMVVKGYVAGTGAMIGGVAGLVSDDFSNVGKWGAAGLGGGWAAGKGVLGAADNIVGSFEGKGSEFYAATHTSKEVKAHINDKLDKDWKRDSKIIDKYQHELKVSRAKAKEIMEKDAMEYRKQGITDDSIIIKAMKLEGYGERASTQRMQLASIASQVSGQKEMEAMEKSLVKNRGFDAKVAKKYMDDVREMKGDTV